MKGEKSRKNRDQALASVGRKLINLPINLPAKSFVFLHQRVNLSETPTGNRAKKLGKVQDKHKRKSSLASSQWIT